MRALLTLMLLPALVRCSSTGLLYRNADWLIERWVDQLLDLTAEQKAQWRSHLDLALTQHRELVARIVRARADLEALSVDPPPVLGPPCFDPVAANASQADTKPGTWSGLRASRMHCRSPTCPL